MSLPFPTKQSLPVFPFTQHAIQTIDVIPTVTDSDPYKYYDPGHLVSYVSVATGTGGFFQGTEYVVYKVTKTPVGYTSGADLQLSGIVIASEPMNHVINQDIRQLLSVTDRSLNLNTIAAEMRRVAIMVNPGIAIGEFYDATADAAEQLNSADFMSDVYVSKTEGGKTGSEGLMCLDAHKATTTPKLIGKLVGIPVDGGTFGYVQYLSEAFNQQI